MMTSYINYLLEANFLLLVAGAVYIFLITKEQAFDLRRYFILLAVVAGLTIPLIQIPIDTVSPGVIPFDGLATVVLPEAVLGTDSELSSEASFNIWSVMVWIYLGVCLALSLRFAISLYKIGSILRDDSNEHTRADGYTLIESIKYPTFSFWNYLVLNKKASLTHEEKSQVLAHELVHIRQRHTIDLVIMELLTIAFWYNPVVWYFKRAQGENHEFIADAQVSDTHDHETYQQLLLKMTIAEMSYMGNYFSKTETLKRINMMNEERKRPGRLRIGLSLTLLIVVMSFLACNDELVDMVDSAEMTVDVPTSAQAKLDELKSKYQGIKFVYLEVDAPEDGRVDFNTLGLDPKTIQSVEPYPERSKIGIIMAANEDFKKLAEYSKKEGAYDLVDEQPVPKEGMTAFYRYIGSEMSYPADARKRGAEGRVFVQFVVDEKGELTDAKVAKGFDEACDAEALRVINGSGAWMPGKLDGEAVKVRMILPITFKLADSDQSERKVRAVSTEKAQHLEETVVVGYSKE